MSLTRIPRLRLPGGGQCSRQHGLPGAATARCRQAGPHRQQGTHPVQHRLAQADQAAAAQQLAKR